MKQITSPAVKADSSLRPADRPHDCTGPVTLIANLHLTLAAPNALVLETVRTYTRGFYRDLVTSLPRIEQGYAYPLTAPGLGAALQPDLKRRPRRHHPPQRAPLTLRARRAPLWRR